MKPASDIEHTAALWLSRREDDGWEERNAAELEAWLDADSRHRLAFWRMEYGWSKARRIAALKRDPGRRRPRRWFPSIRGRRVAPMAAAVAAAAVLALMVQGPSAGDHAYSTPIGGLQSVALADGSRVELNTATKLRTRIEKDVREAWLDRGEAYFDIAHDPARPFVVHAGAREVTVLGTRFSVRRDGDRVIVAVAEGRVRISDPKIDRPHVVKRGDIVLAEPAATLVTEHEPIKVETALSWREGRLEFRQTTLASAAAEFNRYNRRRIVIADEETASIRIGGSFEVTNIDAFTRLLERGFELKVRKEGDSIIISS